MRWIRAGGGCQREGEGNCLKYLKGEWSRKEGRGNKDFKKGEGRLGQGVGAFKRWGAGTPLGTMYIILKKNVYFTFYLFAASYWLPH